MNKKYIIIITAFAIILIIASILFYIKNKNDKPQNTTGKTNTISISGNSTTIDDPSESGNQETGGAGVEYSRDQLNNYELVIYGLTEENVQEVPDVEDFKIALKEYIFQHGLINANAARVTSTARQGNILQYVFQLMEDDIRERGILIAHVNVVTGKYNFAYQK